MTDTTDSGARRRDADGQRSAAEPTRSVPATGTDSTDTASTRNDAPATAVEPTRVALDPTLDGHQKQGITGGTWIALILGTLILILLLIFILQNNVAADFAFFGLAFSLPLGVAMLFAAIAGVLIAALLGSVRLFKLSRRVRKLEKERETIKRAMR
ncbi:LapA family protein [Agrococcus citreus]|uniref:Lipopolysaccharide assembly protein A domain-containing protein n=1 Tax=Agrococcus citreus TaxID=84643 RepID=A0ABN1Z0L9_9MICO